MKVGWFLAALIFYFLQTSVNGADDFYCGSTKWSFYKGGEFPLVYSPESKLNHCEDSCTQFKCIIEDDVLIQGSVCYQSFEDTCRYIPTQLKEQLKKKMDHIVHVDSSLIFASENTDYGGINEYREMIKLQPEAETNFAAHIKTKWDGKNNVTFLAKFSEPRDNKESVECGTKQICKSGSKYDVAEALDLRQTKICDACVAFMCTEDGKKIMYGSGCYEDFDKACGNVAAADKQVIKGSIKNSFHYGKNFVAASCSHDDNCAQLELKRYTYINKEAYETFSKNIDKSFDQRCEYQPLTINQAATTPRNFQPIEEQESTTTVTSPVPVPVAMPESSSSFASINIKLFGMLIFGFAFIYLW